MSGAMRVRKCRGLPAPPAAGTALVKVWEVQEACLP